jgi:hypothetical protein
MTKVLARLSPSTTGTFFLGVKEKSDFFRFCSGLFSFWANKKKLIRVDGAHEYTSAFDFG